MSISATKRATLTDALIKRLQADKEIRQITEANTGLVYRYSTTSRERGSFHLRHYQNGQERWAFVARHPQVTTKQAREIHRTMKANLYSAPKAATLISRHDTLAELLQWFDERVQKDPDLGDSRKASTRSIIRRHLVPMIGDIRCDALCRQQVDELLVQPLRLEHEGSYVRQIFGVLAQATKHATIMNMMMFDPLAGWRFKDFVNTRISPRLPRLTQSELNSLIGVIPSEGRNRVLIQLMVMWGTRIGETLAMRWAWVDKTGGMVRIPARYTKTKVQLDIPLTPQAVAVLDKWKSQQRRAHTMLFPGSKGKTLDESTAHKDLKKISQGEWKAHDLRKLARTMWSDQGVDFAVAEAMLNHQISGLNVIYNASQMLLKKTEALTTHHHHLERSGLFI